MNNTFCKNCHRIPSQCCCTPVKTLTDEDLLRQYIAELEKALESSLALNKAQAERQKK